MFDGLPETFECLQWHSAEVTELPQGAAVLATSPACAVQAMRWGPRAFSAQFHVEIEPDTVGNWAKIPEYAGALEQALGAEGLAGTAGDWRDLCAQALTLAPDTAVIRAFLESNFVPVQVRNNEDAGGLFTGYYEASLKGSRVQSDVYKTPLYLRPDELVMVHLGRFRDSLKGQRIAGLVKNGELYPFASRKEIDDGALANRDLEIVWVDSAVDAFFLHIQGSGYVEMDDGSALRVGYAAQNGHPYYAIRTPAPNVLAQDVDSFQLVEGIITSTADVRGRVYLNFGADYKTDFTVAIDKKHRKRFKKAGLDLLSLEGARVRVRGWIELTNGPVIWLDHPERLEVLD